MSPLTIQLFASRKARQMIAHTENAQKIKNSVDFILFWVYGLVTINI